MMRMVVVSRFIVVCLLVATLLLASATCEERAFRGVGAVATDGGVYVGGYAGTLLNPVPIVVFLSRSKAAIYTIEGSGVTEFVRLSGGVVAAGGFLRDWGVARGFVLVINGSLVRGMALTGPSSVYIADALYADKSVVVAGYFQNPKSGDLDAFAARLTPDGRILAAKCYGSWKYPDLARRLLVAQDGFVLLGETWAYNVSQSDVLLAKLGWDLSLRESYSIGGAGLDVGEDGLVTQSGDYVVVGYTEGEGAKWGFVARVSRVGGLLWLRRYSTLGDTFLERIYFNATTGEAYVIGAGVFEEGKRDTFLLVLKDLWGWSFNESALQIIRVTPSQEVAGDLYGSDIFLYRSGGVTVIRGNEGGVDFAIEGPSVNTTALLDDSWELVYYTGSLYGWRVLRGVVAERECPDFKVELLNFSYVEVPVNFSETRTETGRFERKFDPALVLRRFIERNVPLLLLTPAITVFVAIALAATKRVHVLRTRGAQWRPPVLTERAWPWGSGRNRQLARPRGSPCGTAQVSARCCSSARWPQLSAMLTNAKLSPCTWL